MTQNQRLNLSCAMAVICILVPSLTASFALSLAHDYFLGRTGLDAWVILQALLVAAFTVPWANWVMRLSHRWTWSDYIALDLRFEKPLQEDATVQKGAMFVSTDADFLVIEPASAKKGASRIRVIARKFPRMTETRLTPDGRCAECGTTDLHKPACRFYPKEAARA